MQHLTHKGKNYTFPKICSTVTPEQISSKFVPVVSEMKFIVRRDVLHFMARACNNN